MVSREVKEGKHGGYALYTHMKIMKPVETDLRKGENRRGRIREGVNLIKIHFQNICKSHTEMTHKLMYVKWVFLDSKSIL
jgi:hypothetical protein